MVILGEGREREREAERLMAMGHERSKALHNFTMPCLKWGNQKLLRCMKLNSNLEGSAADRRSSSSEIEKALAGRRRRESELEMRGSIDRFDFLGKSPSPSPTPAVGGRGYERKLKADCDGDDGIEAIRAKLMFDLQTAADKMKVAILREGLEEESPAPVVLPAVAEVEAVRPWNLRTRRAACKAPNGIVGGVGSCNGGGGQSLKVDERKPNHSPVRSDSKSPRSRGVTIADNSNPSGEMKERAKFSVSLSRREIGEDFMEFAGQRPPRRPKKRAKIVQRQLDSIFPGLWLTEVTADSYRVPDVPETGNR